jgi:glycine betaine/proline transport system permease protein
MITSPLSVDLRAAPRIDNGLIIWLAVFAAVAFCLAFANTWPWIVAYPPEWVLPIAAWIDVATDWFTHLFEPLFRAITWTLNGPMRGLRDILQWMPWPATILLVAVLALSASGWRLALFCTLSLLYLVGVGYWAQSMNTMALVMLAVPLSIIIGFALGVMAFRLPKARAGIEALLDCMQTMPAFA